MKERVSRITIALVAAGALLCGGIVGVIVDRQFLQDDLVRLKRLPAWQLRDGSWHYTYELGITSAAEVAGAGRLTLLANTDETGAVIDATISYGEDEGAHPTQMGFLGNIFYGFASNDGHGWDITDLDGDTRADIIHPFLPYATEDHYALIPLEGKWRAVQRTGWTEVQTEEGAVYQLRAGEWKPSPP